MRDNCSYVSGFGVALQRLERLAQERVAIRNVSCLVRERAQRLLFAMPLTKEHVIHEVLDPAVDEAHEKSECQRQQGAKEQSANVTGALQPAADGPFQEDERSQDDCGDRGKDCRAIQHETEIQQTAAYQGVREPD